MKRILTSISFLILLLGAAQAQTVPQGMNYQAVARDHKGLILGNQSLELSVRLYADADPGDVVYSETHRVQTSELGLFNMIIGTGEVNQGRFEAVPWSTSEIWMEVAIRKSDDENFVTLSNSQMLSVPYAFHAATAGELSGSAEGERGGTNDPFTKVWHIQGNTGTNPTRDKLGTGDFADLVVVTTNEERMRIMRTGEVMIREDLHAGQNVYLNLPDSNFMLGQPDLTPIGHTINYGDFTVENQSKTLLTGTLDVNGNAQMDQKLNVDGLTTVSYDEQSFNPSKGAFTVMGGAGIGKNLNVGGAFGLTGDATFHGLVRMLNSTQSTSPTTGALVVTGGVGIGGNVNINGVTSIANTLNVTRNDTGYVAKITNTNGATGDGLVIKLGRKHPARDGNSWVSIPNPGNDFAAGATETFVGWLEGEEFNPVDILDLVPHAYVLGSACGLLNSLMPDLNSVLTLPMDNLGKEVLGSLNSNLRLNMPLDPDLLEGHLEYATDFFDDVIDFVGDVVGFSDNEPPINFLSGLPNLPVLGNGIQQFGFTSLLEQTCASLPSFQPFNPQLINVDNSLTNENQFISFRDHTDLELGSIRAQSVVDWETDYLSNHLVPLILESISLDPLDIAMGVMAAYTEIADGYNSIGVEYASGHGDYAEWLERMDHDEVIGAGDIVAVAGGKITKDLLKAEQVMAVSAYPIMLGNAPTTEEEPLGNKVAFMGQIPVKILGPVSSGDYIIGNSSTPGYGIAVHPSDLQPEQGHLIVGRSWDTNLNPGPKMTNTVVGVDNGYFLRIMQDSQATVKQLDSRVADLENKLETIMAAIPQYAGSGGKSGKRQ